MRTNRLCISLSLPSCLLLLSATLLSAAPTPRQIDGEQQFGDLGTCQLESGKQIQHCRIGYRTFGTLNGTRSNAVLFPTYFTGRTDSLVGNVGPGKMLDPSRYFVILVDALGDGVSSSPSNSKAQPRLAFPEFTIRDMVNSQYRLLTEVLKLKRIHAVIGISMGGMQAFQWLVTYPNFMDVVIPIVGSPQLTSTDLLLWTSELHAIEDDPAWRHGNYRGHPTLRAVVDIHQFAVTTPIYRAKDPGRANFQSYLQKAETSVAFDWNDWYRQLQAMLRLDIAKPWNGSLEQAARHAKARLLAIVAEQDHMVNPLPAMQFVTFAKAQQVVLIGDCGHLAPGCESKKTNDAVQRFLMQ